MRAVLCILCLPILFTFSCYNPNYALGNYACSTAADCPGGFSCVAGRCTQGTSQQRDGEMGQQDLSAGGNAPDLQVPPCNSGDAIQIGPAVHACTGNFDGNPDLCNPGGFHVCGPNDVDALGQVDAGLCAKLPGFYAADISAHIDMSDAKMRLSCGNAGGPVALPGCGKEGMAMPPKNGGNCHNLLSGLQCDGSQPPWTCDKDHPGLANATHDSTQSPRVGGVLCCLGASQ